jgi:hypothetical protein
MALLKVGGPGSERLRYFWVAERVTNDELGIEHLGTKKMFSNIPMKQIQGS